MRHNLRNAQTKPPPGSEIDWGHPLTINPDGSKAIVGCWLFNEGAGSRVNDVSGNNYGTLSSASWIGGKYGHAINSLVTIQNSDVFNFGLSNFSLIAWWDYGSSITVNDGESFTVDFGASTLTIA